METYRELSDYTSSADFPETRAREETARAEQFINGPGGQGSTFDIMLAGMTRPLRVNVEGGWYHVFGRGSERRTIFTETRDIEHFYELLRELRERYRIVIHAHVCLTSIACCANTTHRSSLLQIARDFRSLRAEMVE